VILKASAAFQAGTGSIVGDKAPCVARRVVACIFERPT
jgi:hypothetical protein